MRPRGILNLPVARCTAPNVGHTLHHVKPIQGSVCPPSNWGGTARSTSWIHTAGSQLCGVNTTILQLQFVHIFDIYVVPHRAPWQKSRNSQWERADWGSVSCQGLHMFTVTVPCSQPGPHPSSSSSFLFSVQSTQRKSGQLMLLLTTLMVLLLAFLAKSHLITLADLWDLVSAASLLLTAGVWSDRIVRLKFSLCLWPPMFLTSVQTWKSSSVWPALVSKLWNIVRSPWRANSDWTAGNPENALKMCFPVLMLLLRRCIPAFLWKRSLLWCVFLCPNPLKNNFSLETSDSYLYFLIVSLPHNRIFSTYIHIMWRSYNQLRSTRRSSNGRENMRKKEIN